MTVSGCTNVARKGLRVGIRVTNVVGGASAGRDLVQTSGSGLAFFVRAPKFDVRVITVAGGSVKTFSCRRDLVSVVRVTNVIGEVIAQKGPRETVRVTNVIGVVVAQKGLRETVRVTNVVVNRGRLQL